VSSVQGPTLTDVQTDDSDIFVIGIRENVTARAWSLVLMESEMDSEEQDIDLGMNTYCLVVEPEHATVYGGVLDCELQATSLRLRLTAAAADELGMPADATFPLALGREQLAVLRRGLRRVLTSGPPGTHPRLIGV
jgi:hypothetical protein